MSDNETDGGTERPPRDTRSDIPIFFETRKALSLDAMTDDISCQ